MPAVEASCPFKARRCDAAPLIRSGQLTLSALPIVNNICKTQTAELSLLRWLNLT